MTVEKVFYDGKLIDLKDIKDKDIKDDLEKLTYISMLCNDTKVSANNELTGDPTETALVDMGFKLHFAPDLYVSYPRVEEVPFDSDRKLMTTVNKVGDKYIAYVKGGIDELLQRANGPP